MLGFLLVGRVEGGKEIENIYRIKMFVIVICNIVNFDKCYEVKL